MRILDGKEKEDAQRWLDRAVADALKSRCGKSQRGVIIVNAESRDILNNGEIRQYSKSHYFCSNINAICYKNEMIIGRGCNNPPLEIACLQEKCYQICAQYCVHAEQNAILNALKNGFCVKDARMYHSKVKNGWVELSREPSCVECSKLVLQSCISEFVMKTQEGICCYGAQEFHELSLAYLVQHKS